jgi:hypothetical protein
MERLLIAHSSAFIFSSIFASTTFALNHRLARPPVSVRFWPISAPRDRQKSADSFEKVGHDFHDRKVCA